MTEPSQKPWYLKLPAKLAATVFFLVALTTLIGNLLELDAKRRERAAQLNPAGATPVPATAPPIADADVDVDPGKAAAAVADAAPVERRVALQLERIVVLHDGSVGTTDWRFAVEADDEPVFVLQQDALDDAAGRNVALPAGARTTLRIEPAGALVTVKGWRGSRLRLPSTEPDATGQGRLSHGGTLAPVEVVASDAQGGRFILHFTATPVD